ncbi:MAG: hypothetical protein WBL35_12890 [Ornithinibacter sp.]
MMAILLLTGTPAQFEQLLTVPGFYLDHRTLIEAGGGRNTMSTFMDESAIPDIEALGISVEVEVTDAELATHMASFHDDGPPVG